MLTRLTINIRVLSWKKRNNYFFVLEHSKFQTRKILSDEKLKSGAVPEFYPTNK